MLEFHLWLVRVGGARPPPLITFTLTTKVGVYAPAEWADTLTLFHLYQYVYSVIPPIKDYINTELVFLNVYGAQGSIPRHQFRQPV